jgi:hypothetical protein
MFAVTRIPVPDWAPPYARGQTSFADGFTEEHYNAVQPHREAILALVDRTVAEYLDRYSFDDGFPQRDRLTGEYYVGGEYYRRSGEPYPGYTVNVHVRCLKKPQPPRVIHSDYLGLDVRVYLDERDGSLHVHATDSSVI